MPKQMRKFYSNDMYQPIQCLCSFIGIAKAEWQNQKRVRIYVFLHTAFENFVVMSMMLLLIVANVTWGGGIKEFFDKQLHFSMEKTRNSREKLKKGNSRESSRQNLKFAAYI